MPTSSQQIEITGLTEDSRKVKTGFLFAAMQGTKTDGVNYIDDAIKRGASVILAPLGTKISNKDVLLIEDENPRKRMALMASCFYGKQPENIAAVTGTNGKTSVSDFVRQIWKYLGKKSASIGTLGVKISGEKTLSFDDGITTPDSSRLHKILKNLADNDINHVAMEATSHGLAMHRLDGVKIKIAAFTNLTRDHLDYHKDMDNYLSAKKRLFSDFINILIARWFYHFFSGFLNNFHRSFNDFLYFYRHIILTLFLICFYLFIIQLTYILIVCFPVFK